MCSPLKRLCQEQGQGVGTRRAPHRGVHRSGSGQVHSALRNVATDVRGAGGGVEDITRSTFYIVDWTPKPQMPFRGEAKGPHSLVKTREWGPFKGR